MKVKIIITKELNEWLKKHQTLPTENTSYGVCYGSKILDELIDEVWEKLQGIEKYKNFFTVLNLSRKSRVAHLWLLLNRYEWKVEK